MEPSWRPGHWRARPRLWARVHAAAGKADPRRPPPPLPSQPVGRVRMERRLERHLSAVDVGVGAIRLRPTLRKGVVPTSVGPSSRCAPSAVLLF